MDTNPDDPDDDNNDANELDEVLYYLCPICLEEGKETGFENVQGVMGHAKAHPNTPTKGLNERIITTKKKPENLIKKKIEYKMKTPSTPPSNKGGNMSQDDDQESNAPDVGEAAHLIGKIKQLLLLWSKFPADSKDTLLPERQELVAFMQRLNQKNITGEDIANIEGKVDVDIKPLFDEYTPKKKSDGKTDDEESPKEMNTDLKMSAEKIRSSIRSDLTKIAELPTEYAERLSAEKGLLMELNRELCKDDITKKKLNDIEARYTSYTPGIQAIVKKVNKHTKHDDDDDDDFEDYEDFEKQDLKRMKRQLGKLRMTQEIEETKAMMKSLRQENQPQQQQMMLVSRPKIDMTTGEIALDENGQPIMEQGYQHASATGMDPLSSFLLSAILPSLVSGNKNDNSLETQRLMLEMKKEDLEFRKFMIEHDNKDSGSSAEIVSLRRDNQTIIETMYKNELTRVSDQLNRTQHALQNTDQLGDLLEQKNKLQELGLVGDPATQNAQDKQVAYAKDTMEKVKTEAEGLRSDAKAFMGPMMSAQNEIMKQKGQLQIERERLEIAKEKANLPQSQQQQQQQGPPEGVMHDLSEEEKNARWRELYRAVEEGVEEGEEEYYDQ